jgi:hypothetical protein
MEQYCLRGFIIAQQSNPNYEINMNLKEFFIKILVHGVNAIPMAMCKTL